MDKITTFLQLSFLSSFVLCQKDGLNIITRPMFLEENMYFELIDPVEISYTYKIKSAKDFGPDLNSTYYGLELIPTSPSHGCSEITNADDISGAVAFIERGGCSFLSKTIHAEQAGALLAIIMDNEVDNDGRMVDMIEDGTDRSTNIPSFFMLGKDGHMIKHTLENLGRYSATINIPLNITGLNSHHLRQPPWTLW